MQRFAVCLSILCASGQCMIILDRAIKNVQKDSLLDDQDDIFDASTVDENINFLAKYLAESSEVVSTIAEATKLTEGIADEEVDDRLKDNFIGLDAVDDFFDKLPVVRPVQTAPHEFEAIIPEETPGHILTMEIDKEEKFIEFDNKVDQILDNLFEPATN